MQICELSARASAAAPPVFLHERTSALNFSAHPSVPVVSVSDMSGLYLPSTLSSMETPWEMLPSVGMRDAPPDPATTEPERVPATEPLMDDDMRRGGGRVQL